jgi:hypothetical protein
MSLSILPAAILAGVIKSFDRAYEEAVKAGKYLALAIANERVFGHCPVNLVGFSLGTVVI